VGLGYFSPVDPPICKKGWGFGAGEDWGSETCEFGKNRYWETMSYERYRTDPLSGMDYRKKREIVAQKRSQSFAESEPRMSPGPKDSRSNYAG